MINRSSWSLCGLLLLVVSQKVCTDAFTTNANTAVTLSPVLSSSLTKKGKPLLLVPPLFHMGHSHSHHDHQVDDIPKKKLSPKALRRKRRRRLALWVFGWLATCGSRLIARRRLRQLDWIAFVVISALLTSADKVRFAVRNSIDKFQNLKAGIAKHSGNSGNVISTQDTTAANRVTWISVLVNLLLSAGKLVIGITSHSSALIADAGHSLSDLISDFITLYAVQIARLPPDDDHPYGHSKFEAIGSLFLSLTLLATGVSVGTMANRQLLQLLAKSSASGAASILLPGPLALVMAGISIASKEWLFRITKVVGERLQSPVVIANAWHHRSDAYSSVLALLSIAMARAGFPAADAAAGLLVAGMICMTGGDILVESIQQLSDSANEELQESVRTVVETYIQSDDDDILRVTSIRARQVGSSAFIDVTVETPPHLSTTATRAVEERLKRHLAISLNQQVLTATVHAKPKLMVVCPLLENQQEQDDVVVGSANSASALEFLVRQQALLLYPKIESLSGVTVHYAAQNNVTVDVNIVIEAEENQTPSLPQIKECAKELQDSLEDLPEIAQANIYLDLSNSRQRKRRRRNAGLVLSSEELSPAAVRNINTTTVLAP